MGSIVDTLLPGISDKEKSELVLPDLSTLSFNFTNKDQIIDKDIDTFDFELTGSFPIKWNPDQNLLKNLLVDKNKNDIANIFKQDPGITSASVKIIPFWSEKLPQDQKNINIILK